MSIWYNKNITLQQIQHLGNGNMGQHLGMEFIEIGTNYLKATMPVDHRTKQPYGLLHGGASVALAETVGSVASALVINPQQFICVGVEINANHLKAVKEGFVTATATPFHLGATTHVWNIQIENNKGQLICISRLTVSVLKNKTL